MPSRSPRRLRAARPLRPRLLTMAVAAGVALSALTLGSAAHAHPAAPRPGHHAQHRHPAPQHRATSEFRGVNWADPRDNYASDAVVPSGLAVTDSYRTVYRITTSMVAGFRHNLGANTLRLPINPASVGTAWWRSYRATIDAATREGDKVILSYWESDTSKDGFIDDVPAWNAMWDTVVREYRHDPRVYFEPMNEPHGYTLDQWVDVVSGWLHRHSGVPRSRVVVSGTGYNDDVTGVGAAPALRGTLLSLHYYGYWNSFTAEADWKANLAPRIGRYADRTIIDEAGAPMTIGLNYGAHDGNVYTSYFAALTDTARADHMGIVYWPGLRTGDSYSIESLDQGGSLVNNSPSGVAQLRWGWGIGAVPPVNDDPAAPPGEPLRGAASGRCLDVPGFSTTAGTALDVWDCNAGGNQSWNLDADGQLTVYGTMCLSVAGGATAGAAVDIESCAGRPDQQWAVNADGTVTSTADPGLCLTATGTANGSAVQVAACRGTDDQRWTRS